MDVRYFAYTYGDKYYRRPKKPKYSTEYKLNCTVSDGWLLKSDEHWQYCMSSIPLPVQGWKIHISCVIEEAQKVLDLVAPALIDRKVSFKFVKDMVNLVQKNSKYGDRGSSGKFMAIYTINEEQFQSLVQLLEEILKETTKGPYILSDKRWKNTNIFFRYGGFKKMYLYEGSSVLAIQTPDGAMIADYRLPYYEVPEFVIEPEFIRKADEEELEEEDESSPLDDYEISEAIHFSNGGGVYKGTYKKTGDTVVIKEGRPHAGIDGVGRDAYTRVKYEGSVLEKINSDYVVSFKRIFRDWEHIFLVEEFLDGISLQQWIALHYPFSMEKDVSSYTEKALHILEQLITAVKEVHSLKIGIGDLQPGNVMVMVDLSVKLIDFEVADDYHSEKPSALHTPGFTTTKARNREMEDWFALTRIAKFIFLPIGPIADLSNEVDCNHSIWISKNFGQDVCKAIKRIEDICQTYMDMNYEKPLFAPDIFIDQVSQLPLVISKLRAGILKDMTYSEEQLIPGDIRQYLMPGGMLNCLSGGFGVVMALARTGTLTKEIISWVEKYSKDEFIRKIPEGLFTGKAGIASVLYELGMKERAFEIFDQIVDCSISNVTFGSGLSGIGLAALAVSNAESGRYLKKCIIMANKMYELFLKDIRLSTIDEEFVPYGLIDGWAGVAFYYIHLYKATKDSCWLQRAIEVLNKDLTNCIFDEDGGFQVKDRTRSLPYVAGGSAGIGIVINEIKPYVENKMFEKEQVGIFKAIQSRCFYCSGVARGYAGLLDYYYTNIESDQKYLHEFISTLNLYLLADDDAYFVCGEFGFKISADLFSGSAGMMLVLSSILSKSRYNWLPVYVEGLK